MIYKYIRTILPWELRFHLERFCVSRLFHMYVCSSYFGPLSLFKQTKKQKVSYVKSPTYVCVWKCFLYTPPQKYNLMLHIHSVWSHLVEQSKISFYTRAIQSVVNHSFLVHLFDDYVCVLILILISSLNWIAINYWTKGV